MPGNYKTLTKDTLDRIKAESDRSESNYMKLKEGTNKVRFLPSIFEHDPIVVVTQHYVKGEGYFTCAHQMYRRWCFICDKAAKMKRSGSEEDYKIADEWYPRKRHIANVIDRSDPDFGPKILAFPKTIFEALEKIARNPDTGGDYCEPGPEGFDIIIERTGTGMKDTTYTVMADRKNSPLGNEEWIEMQQDLGELLVCRTPEELEELLGAARPPVDVRALPPRGGGGGRALPPGGGRAEGGGGGGAAPTGRGRRRAEDDIHSPGSDD